MSNVNAIPLGPEIEFDVTTDGQQMLLRSVDAQGTEKIVAIPKAALGDVALASLAAWRRCNRASGGDPAEYIKFETKRWEVGKTPDGSIVFNWVAPGDAEIAFSVSADAARGILETLQAMVGSGAPSAPPGPRH
jgi:hypothetical protein